MQCFCHYMQCNRCCMVFRLFSVLHSSLGGGLQALLASGHAVRTRNHEGCFSSKTWALFYLLLVFFVRNMCLITEQILLQIELGHLVENFKAQRVDMETAVLASDGELQRLSVGTIGDRVSLREPCRRFRCNSQPLSSISEAVVAERVHLFNISRSSTS